MDRRETAWDPFGGSFNDKTMVGLLYGDDEPVKCHWEVCDVCDGNGQHVNPSIDSHGITSDEMYADPDFAEDYFRGVYDVSCAQCNGRRVMPVPDKDDPNAEAYADAVRGHHEYLAEVAAEQRMGA